jgi:membrane protease YdiL (CAAX protease family)
MITKKLSIYSTVFLLATAPLFVFAQQDVVSPILRNAVSAVRILIALAFLLALFVFAWGIVKFIIAAGDPEKIKEARQFILWGVIGLAVLASIFGLITFLQNYFGVSPGAGAIPIPGVPPQAP